MANLVSFRETVSLVQDFLEVAFHTILCLRKVYPAELFKQHKKYGIPVWQSRNPLLREYIGRAVQSVAEELAKATIRNVLLLIRESGPDQMPLERFRFDLEWLLSSAEIPEEGKDMTPLAMGLAEGDVEDHFRKLLSKLNALLLQLPPLSEDITFAIILTMRDDEGPPESAAARREEVPTEWYPADARDAPNSEDGKFSRLDKGRANRLGMLQLQFGHEPLDVQFVEPLPSEPSTMDSDDVPPKVDVKGKGKARAF